MKFKTSLRTKSNQTKNANLKRRDNHYFVCLVQKKHLPSNVKCLENNDSLDIFIDDSFEGLNDRGEEGSKCNPNISILQKLFEGIHSCRGYRILCFEDFGSRSMLNDIELILSFVNQLDDIIECPKCRFLSKSMINQFWRRLNP